MVSDLLPFNDVDGDSYTLGDMRNPVLAAGHCFDVSQLLLRLAEFEDGFLVVVETDDDADWWHVAVGVIHPVTQETMVVDYTMKQFGVEFGFPYIQHYDQWVEDIHDVTGFTLRYSEELGVSL